MKKLITSLVIISVVLFWGPSEVFAYSGGSGTPEAPYQIATKADLLQLAGSTADYDKCFILTADIDLDPNLPDGQVFTTALVAPDIDSDSSGWQGTAFRGTFDGDGHEIKRLTINGGDNDYTGLFGCIGYVAELKNLGIENCAISGREFVGGLLGKNGGSIINCYAIGEVSGYHRVGGLVGANFGVSISNCYSTGSISGNWKVGGLVGDGGSSISNSYATGSVSGNGYVGGLMGSNYSRVVDCYATGSVSGDYAVGGLVGASYSSIYNCYATGSVDGNDYVGGLVGRNGVDARLSNCYATGSGNGISYVGGLVGASYSSISNCYATGSISGNDYVGGLLGKLVGGDILNSFWDIETSGTTTSAGGEGKTTEQMQDIDTYLNAGWDFNTPIWEMCPDTNDYPHLWWEYYCNVAPVAIAGPNQVAYAWIDSFADITLDGSSSYDDDNDVLDYYWSWTIDGNDYEANGVSSIITLPVGEHKIELIVDDGWVLSEPDYCTINVVEPLNARLFCYPRVLNTRSHGRFIMAVMIMPGDIEPADINDAEPLLFLPGNIEAKRQFVWRSRGWRHRRTYIMAIFDKPDCMENLSIGRNEVEVIGRLNTGRYFYGTDNLRLIDKRSWLWRHRRWNH